MKDKKEFGFSTRAIHIGSDPDPTTGAVITPIYATSTYKQESPGVHKGYDYGRSHNLTRFAYERCIASLEGGAQAFAFSSGLAGMATVLELLPAGSHLISGDDIYGGTFRLFDKVRKSSANLAVSYVGLENAEQLEKHITPQTKMLWVETPTNPLLKLADLERLAALAKKHQLISVADNTFASPYLQNPLALGFDLVVHSATKYLNGHSDVIGGVVVCREQGPLSERIGFLQNAIGSVPGPFDCFLAHRGVKTLAVRMQRQCENAQRIAEYLAAHPQVTKVYYPGLASHPQYALAKKQMRLPGGMISFVLKGGIPEARRFLESVSVFSLAESLGAVESLIEHPAIMTHATIPPEQRKALGIDDGFIRISCGIEECDDLIADLEGAFARM
ncbi:MAG: PLP-dependent transferase [Proteobacteria bacterium]|nr:PLP-dependent transferase [Pseudomonadota bacterium]